MLLVVHPFLALLGIAGLFLKKSLNLSWWIGLIRLLYVGSMVLFMFMGSLGFWLPGVSFEMFYSVTFITALVGLLVVMKRRL